MSSKSADAPVSSGSSSGLFAETLRGTFTTPGEREIWSHFIPLRKLGKGSFGSVVAATRVADNVPVAIKTILIKRVPFVEVDDGVCYPEEVVTLNELCESKGAIKVLDFLETEDKVIIVLERPDDFIDLATYLRKKTYVDEEAAKIIILQLISCIIEFLKLNILHRDLKPANILVNEKTLEIKVIDFGFTSFVDSSDDILYDRMGTEVYLPPESVHKKQFFAGPGMVWVIGIIAFKILTGSRPFLDDREIETGPLQIPSRLSSACSSFIKSCLNRSVISRLSLNSLANHSFFTSVCPGASNLDTICKDKSPKFLGSSYCGVPEEDIFDEENFSSDSSNITTPSQPEAKKNKSGFEAMSCEGAQSIYRNTDHDVYFSISSDSEFKFIQDKSVDEAMSCQEAESTECKTDDGVKAMLRSHFSSSISSEILIDHETIQPKNKPSKKISQKNTEFTLRRAEKASSVQQICQFDSSMWEFIPVATEDLQTSSSLSVVFHEA